MNQTNPNKPITSIFCGTFGCIRIKPTETTEGDIMNPAQLLDQAALAMQQINDSNAHMFVVGYREDKIVCVPAYDSVSLEIQFERFTSVTIHDGLTAKQWDRLSDKITKFYFQKGLL